jgi:hypothetical protein
MKVLDPKAFDAILGYDWLQQYSPMICHWKNKTMSFTLQGKQIELQGVLPPPKWCACNEIGAFAIVEPMPEDSKQNHVPEVQQLFQEFQDVFDDPKTLPPERSLDHSIPLFPNAIPVNSRPYRYLPLHKDEIEKQVKALLAAGLITPSSSPFASPVLLVQKKDGSW